MKNMFAETSNVKSLYCGMESVRKSIGESALVVVHGETGRGKTATSMKFSAEENCVYCRVKKGWTALWMLRDLSFELGMHSIPKRTASCFDAAVKEIRDNPRPVFIDEADKLSESLFEWVRDLADLSYVPFILVGEPEILFMMKKQRRIWSRVQQAIEFGPITPQDVLFFSQQSCEIFLTGDQAAAIQAAATGDFRAIRRILLSVENTLSANRSFSANSGGKVTDRIVETAIKNGMHGA
jgi:DNA transposition AAA+ family ATPase